MNRKTNAESYRQATSAVRALSKAYGARENEMVVQLRQQRLRRAATRACATAFIKAASLQVQCIVADVNIRDLNDGRL